MGMKLFISWSGRRSKKVASVFKNNLAQILDEDIAKQDIFFSDKDIYTGTQWFDTVKQNLIESDSILLLVTKENVNSTWLIYEAGAILNKEKSNIFILLLDDNISLEGTPLKHYQSIKKSNLKKLLTDMAEDKNTARQDVIVNYQKNIKPFNDVFKEITQRGSIEKIIITMRETTETVLDSVKNNLGNKLHTPFSEIFVGLLHSLVPDVIMPGKKDMISVPPQSYNHVLSALHKSGHSNIKAIANLRDDKWVDLANEINVWEGISERIFYVKWEDMFDSQRLDRIITIINNSIDSLRDVKNDTCLIYLVTDDTKNDIRISEENKEIFEKRNILFIESELVGWFSGESLKFKYVKDGDTLLNKVIQFYRQFKQKAVTINITSYITKDWLVKEWIRLHDFGVWNSDIVTYVKNYDINIRIWIPDYDKLINTCNETILNELTRLFTVRKESLKVLELGYGTGNLTIKVLAGIMSINSPRSTYCNGHKPIIELFGQDKSVEMMNVLNNKLAFLDYENMLTVTMLNTTFAPEKSHITDMNKVDLIYSSFSFYALVSCEKEEGILQFFTALKLYFRDPNNISIVFLCALLDDENKPMEGTLNYWKKYMHDNYGLSEKSITSVLNHLNKDILDLHHLNRIIAPLDLKATRTVTMNPQFSVIVINNLNKELV